MVVQHNLTAMNANRMLGMTTSSQAKSTEKLSSGYKINRAADDAAGLSISEKMRKQIRGLTKASSNAQDGISAVQTAEGALTEVHDMLQRMNELAVQASNGTNSEDDRQNIQDEIDQLITEIDRVAETTKFNETYLLKGDYNSNSLVYGYTTPDTVIASATDPDATVTLFDVCGSTVEGRAAQELLKKGEVLYKTSGTHIKTTSTAASAAASVVGSDLYDSQGHVVVKAGTVLTTVGDITVGGVFYNESGATVAATTGATLATVAGATFYNADGTIAFKTGDLIDTTAISDISNGKYYTSATVGTEAEAGKDYRIYEYGKLYDKDGNGIAANGLESYFEKDKNGVIVYKGGLYDEVGDAIGTAGDKLIDDTNKELVKHINTKRDGKDALTLKLHVGADATENNQITLDISAMDATTLGVKGVKVSGRDDTNALSAIETVKAAIQRVSKQRSALGAVQNRLEHTINNLDNVVENTTSAESQIRDTDMATEMVNYSKNNILAQAGQAMLAQANQSNQGVLSLLG